MQPITGFCHVYGDSIDTDRIIAGKYTKTLDLDLLANHALEDLDPEFKNRYQPGDIIVGGHFFGCGSSREQAPLALKHLGVGAVVASSFARIFFRNAVNIGLPVFELESSHFRLGDKITINPADGIIKHHKTGNKLTTQKLDSMMLEIMRAGGLVSYLRENSYE